MYRNFMHRLFQVFFFDYLFIFKIMAFGFQTIFEFKNN